MNCVYCNYEVEGKRHELLCPYNPQNTRKILLYLRDYVLTESRFNKNFKPFPKPREFDEFCRKNQISRLKTIARRYLVDDLRLNDWIVELLAFGIEHGIMVGEDFPYFLQFIYDSWIFNTNTEYQKIYEQSIIYEDGYGIWNELMDTGQGKVLEMRSLGVSFLKDKREVRDYFLKGKTNVATGE